METIKYEAVFGDQSLFEYAPVDCIFVVRLQDGNKFYYGEYPKTTTDPFFVVQSDYITFAMRRIIKTPVWTVSDQKAGRLPEVGTKCRQGHKYEIVIAVTEKFVVTECQDMSVCTTRKDVFMRSYNPIETTEERAQRLREEWKNNVIEIHHGKRRKMSTSTFLLDDIYDALLSGELQSPKDIK